MSSRAPDVVGEVLAFRAWRVAAPILEPIALVSLFNDVLWESGNWTVATCEYSSAGIPHEDDGCGIYAAKDRRHLLRMRYSDFAEATIAIGEVALAGDIIPGQQGWRAERARPVRVWLSYEHWQLVRPLALEYGVPVGLTNILSRGGRRGHRTRGQAVPH